MSGKKLGIIFLDRNKFDFYQSSQNSVLKCEIPQTTAKDLEVIDKSSLEVLIRNFISTSKIPPSQIIMVLSQSIFFEKNFIHTKTDLEYQVQIFLDNVPFKNISSKILQLEKGFKVIVTNSDYFEAVKEAFESLGSSVFLVLPAYVFGTEINSLNAETIKVILQKYDSVKQYGLIFQPQQEEPKSSKEKQKQNFRLFLLIGIFVFLLIALIVVFFIFSKK